MSRIWESNTLWPIHQHVQSWGAHSCRHTYGTSLLSWEIYRPRSVARGRGRWGGQWWLFLRYRLVAILPGSCWRLRRRRLIEGGSWLGVKFCRLYAYEMCRKYGLMSSVYNPKRGGSFCFDTASSKRTGSWKTNTNLASYPTLLTPAFVACSTKSDKRWGEKTWVQD